MRFARIPGEAWLAIAAVLILSAGWGLRDPWAPDEPRYVLIASEMLHFGDASITRHGGVLYSEKPPIYFWLLAASLWLGGLRFGFLLPALAAGLGTLALTWDLARRLWGREAALFAGFALLACVQFTLQARSAQIDAVLCFFTTLGLYGLLRHLLFGPDWRWFTLGWFAAGLGVMTKGVGFLPLLILLPWVGLRWSGWPTPRLAGGARWLFGPLAFLAPLVFWLAPLTLAAASDPEVTTYLDELLFRQTITRYADPWHHIRPFWYYFVEVIPWAWFPLLLLAPWLAVRWRCRWRAHDASTGLLLTWVGLVFLFFLLSPGKRDVYLLPVAPALALLAAPHLQALFSLASCRRVLWTAALALPLAASGAAAWLLWVNPDLLAAMMTKYDTSAAPVWTLLVAGLAGCGTTLAMRAGPAALALLIFLGWLLWGWVLQPQLNEVRSGRKVAESALESLPEGAPLALVSWRAQQILHLDRPVVHFRGHHADRRTEVELAAAWLAGHDTRRVLTPAEDLDECFTPGSGQDLGHAHRRDWLLLSRDDLSGACSAPFDPDHMVSLPGLRP